MHECCRVAQSEFRKIRRFRVGEKVHSAQPKRFTRRARDTAILNSKVGGGVVAELSTKKSVDSSKKSFFPRTTPRSRKCNGGGGGGVAEPSKKKIRRFGHKLKKISRLKQAIKIRRKRIFP